MADNGMPGGRKKHVSGAGKDVYKRGDGLGFGPVGSSHGSGRGDSGAAKSGGSAPTRGLGGSKLLIIIVIAVLVLGGGGGTLGGLFGSLTGGSTVLDTVSGLTSILGGATSFSGSNTSEGWSGGNSESGNTGVLNTKVDTAARSKYTVLKGNNKDRVAIYIYMCGTDLESQYKMATADLQEMQAAALSDNIDIIIYTGGAKKWNNSVISSSKNQIYRMTSDGLEPLNKDMGAKAMTKASTLSEFMSFCKSNYYKSADRNILIFWDHGGGSISGYGYDEKYSSSGSMSLTSIKDVLDGAGMKFDFIGFDACLMATAENALMLSQYADYMIASEESEPGIGWYYTGWLNMLSKNSSVSTVELGKKIVDDFITECNKSCRGQKTTLSVTDLAELEKTLPEGLKNFAASTSALMESSSFKQVSDARSATREFAESSKIDQVDLANLALNMETKEGDELASIILSAVKYNRTSDGMTDAYGLSVYFPGNRPSYVNSAVSAYDKIGLGMDEEYSRCVQQFASMEVSGQAVSSGTSSPVSSLLGTLGSVTGSNSSSDMISSVLSGLLGGSLGNISSLTDLAFGSKDLSFMQNGLDQDTMTEYLAANAFDASKLVWERTSDGYPLITLSRDQWKLVKNLELNMFYDDGAGYIDLGFDNLYTFTREGSLVGQAENTWLAINDQPVAYYYLGTEGSGKDTVISGYVPILLNDERAELMIVFEGEDNLGRVAGVRRVYKNGETETQAKGLAELTEGDTIDFICDYYDYSGKYQDSYKLGGQMTYHGKLTVSDVVIANKERLSAMYRFTDIYNSYYWTPELPDMLEAVY